MNFNPSDHDHHFDVDDDDDDGHVRHYDVDDDGGDDGDHEWRLTFRVGLKVVLCERMLIITQTTHQTNRRVA